MKVCSCGDGLALLSGLGQGPTATPPTVPAGFTDWQQIAQQTAGAVAAESSPARQQILQSAGLIAAAALPIPVVGVFIAAGVAVVAALAALFGVRGPTQHVTEAQAATGSYEWARKAVLDLFDRLPADAQDFFARRVVEWDHAMYDTFIPPQNNWWPGTPTHPNPNTPALIRQRRQMPGKLTLEQWLTVPQVGPTGRRNVCHIITTYWFTAILTNIGYPDNAGEMQHLFFDAYQGSVMLQLNNYFLTKYNATIDAYIAAGGQANVSTAGVVGGTTTAVLAGVGILGLLLLGATTGKKRRAG